MSSRTELLDRLSLHFSEMGHFLGFAVRPVILSIGDTFGQLGTTFDVHNADSGSAYTIDWKYGTLWNITVNANCTITLPSTGTIGEYYLRLVQDAVGGHIITLAGGAIVWPNGTTPTFTTTANKFDLVKLVDYGGGSYAGSIQQSY